RRAPRGCTARRQPGETHPAIARRNTARVPDDSGHVQVGVHLLSGSPPRAPTLSSRAPRSSSLLDYGATIPGAPRPPRRGGTWPAPGRPATGSLARKARGDGPPALLFALDKEPLRSVLEVPLTSRR